MRYVDHPYVKALNTQQRKLLAQLPFNPIDADNDGELSRKVLDGRISNGELPQFTEHLKAIKAFIDQARDDELLAPYAAILLGSLWRTAYFTKTPFEVSLAIVRHVQPLQEGLPELLLKNSVACLEVYKRLPWGASLSFVKPLSIEMFGTDTFERFWLTTIDSTCATFLLFRKAPESFAGRENQIMRHMALQLAKPKARSKAIMCISQAFDMEPEHEEFAHDLLMRSLMFEPYDSYMTVQLEKTCVTPEMMFMHLGPLDKMVDFQISGVKNIGISGTRFISFFRFMVNSMEFCNPDSRRGWLVALCRAAESLLKAGSLDANEVINTLEEKLADDLPIELLACLHASGKDQTEQLRALGETQSGALEVARWFKETRLTDKHLFSVCLAANYHPPVSRLGRAKLKALHTDLDL